MPLLVTAAGRKARELSLSADKIPLLRKKILQKKLIRKNVAKKIVENYRQASGGGTSAADQGVTVTLSVAACVVPEVAVTVMLEVPGGVPGF